MSAAVLFCAFCAPALAAEPAGPRPVTLDAGRVSYDDEAGKASAEGGAVLTYEGATIRADRIDYDAVTQKVKASSNTGGAVLLEGTDRTVTGGGLEYDLNTGEGVMTGVKSDLPVGNGTLYVSGEGMRVMPYELALSRGIVSRAGGGDNGPEHVGIAENVSATTCSLDHPHYRIETKRIIFVPGQRLIAKKPRLYLGNAFIFTYPMDYVVRIERKALRHNITPYIEDSEEKGTGVGISGGFEWDTGALDVGLSYWGDTGAEWMLGVEQSIGDGFSVRGGVEYTWSEAWDDHHYSPYAGLYYSRNGWEAALHAVWGQYQEIQKDANNEYRGRLDRRPELSVRTPWVRDPVLNRSWFRFEAMAGSYWERIPSTSYDTVGRYGVTMRNYREYPLSGGVEFFSDINYAVWLYDKNSADQETVHGIVGFRYGLGAVELATGYGRRFVWGESPMSWDRYGNGEVLHQKIRFQLGKEWYLELLGSYDLDASQIEEMNYALQWINDCMKWELRYRDDQTSGSNSSIGLSVSILAYPNTPLSFGQSAVDDPFEPPALPE